jgi:AAHS family 4-hydroxybenzoate transporter-like MFS transporter
VKAAPHSGSTSIDVSETIDRGPWSALQKFVVLLCAASVVLDGFDGQLIGYATPVLIKEWGVTRDAFAPVVAAGLTGMIVGSATAGALADRLGRRVVILGSVLVFSVATMAIGLSNGLAMLAALRFVAGLGIGGALPSATTLAAEYTPLRRRTMAVTATIVCVPLGGMLAGLVASRVLPGLGWRPLFIIGGALPLVLALLLFLELPESVRFLARRPQRWPELAGLFRRMSIAAPSDARFTDFAEQGLAKEGQEKSQGFRTLFARDRARDTLALWAAFFLCLFAVYTAFSWLPTALSAEGLSVAAAGSGLTAYNLGGVIGAIACAQAIARFGSRWPMILCCAGGALSAFALMGTNAADTDLLILGLGVHGLFVNAAQSTMFAVAAHAYPTGIRATGTASAVAFGRTGALTAALVGAGVITASGLPAYLMMLGIAMAGTLVALAAIRNHIPRLART